MDSNTHYDPGAFVPARAYSPEPACRVNATPSSRLWNSPACRPPVACATPAPRTRPKPATFRFFTGSARFVDVYRYNSTGQLWLRVLQPCGTYGYTRLTTQAVPLGSWQRLQMHVIASGPASTVQVWPDGTQVYDSAAVATVATTVNSIMLGAEHYPQPGDECFDDIILRTTS
jgi:hypothetical protein